MGALSHEPKLKQDAKPRRDCFKKNKKDILRTVQGGGGLCGLSHEAKIKKDVKTRSKHSGEDVIYGMGGLIRT